MSIVAKRLDVSRCQLVVDSGPCHIVLDGDHCDQMVAYFSYCSALVFLLLSAARQPVTSEMYNIYMIHSRLVLHVLSHFALALLDTGLLELRRCLVCTV